MACKRSSVRLRYSPQNLNPVMQDFFMPYFVYILYSPSLDQYYVGQTANLDDRLFRHGNSGSKSTKKANDWVLKYTEQFQSRSEAVMRESIIKRKKSKKYIEWIISSAG